MFDMDVHGIWAACLSVISRTIVTLTQHDREITHARFPFLGDRISLWRKREGVLSLDIGQSLSKIGHCVVKRDESDGQLRLLWLIFLVFGCPLLHTPVIFLPLIHLVDGHHLTHPGKHHRVDVTLTAGRVTCDIGNQIQAFHFTVNI